MSDHKINGSFPLEFGRVFCILNCSCGWKKKINRLKDEDEMILNFLTSINEHKQFVNCTDNR